MHSRTGWKHLGDEASEGCACHAGLWDTLCLELQGKHGKINVGRRRRDRVDILEYIIFGLL